MATPDSAAGILMKRHHLIWMEMFLGTVCWLDFLKEEDDLWGILLGFPIQSHDDHHVCLLHGMAMQSVSTTATQMPRSKKKLDELWKKKAIKKGDTLTVDHEEDRQAWH